MPHRFVQYDRDAACEVQAANTRIQHRDGKAAVRVGFEYVTGQAAGLRAENEAIVRIISPVCVEAVGLRRQIDEA